MICFSFLLHFLGDLYPDSEKKEDADEPDWVKTERKQFSEVRDKNKDGRMDKVSYFFFSFRKKRPKFGRLLYDCWFFHVHFRIVSKFFILLPLEKPFGGQSAVSAYVL